jgi:hypothetical protein
VRGRRRGYDRGRSKRWHRWQGERPLLGGGGGASCSSCACCLLRCLLYRRSSKRFCGSASGKMERNATFMSSPWHARTGSTRDPEIAARRHHQLGKPPPPVNAYYCGVSVKQLSKTASGQRVAQPCQRADSEVQVQLEVVCTAEACRGETRWKRHKGFLGEGGGRTMMMYVRVVVSTCT